MVYPDELEDFVSEALYNEFDTIVEDGSLLQVYILYTQTLFSMSLDLLDSNILITIF